jgi:hypothetical protein
MFVNATQHTRFACFKRPLSYTPAALTTSWSAHGGAYKGLRLNASPTRPCSVATADPDLDEQARPGHGIPSQDPSPAAQTPLLPEEVEREAKSVYVGGGAMAGIAAGAAIGVVAGGPVGALVGGTVGAVAGALGGEAAGTAGTPPPATGAKKIIPV